MAHTASMVLWKCEAKALNYLHSGYIFQLKTQFGLNFCGQIEFFDLDLLHSLATSSQHALVFSHPHWIKVTVLGN